MNDNTTALICCFIKAYHNQENKYCVLNDKISYKLLSKNEYEQISYNMALGINFFNPSFQGSKKEAINYIMQNTLSPSVLGRSVFCEAMLSNSVKLGVKQYVIYASGYDTYSYRNKYSNVSVYELDQEKVIDDKIKRLKKAHIDTNNTIYIKCDFTKESWINSLLKESYKTNELSFNSLLGISYYLTKEEFKNLIKEISMNISSGSSIVFDYQTNVENSNTKKVNLLAEGANEKMKAKYDYSEIGQMLNDNNLLIYEHLNYQDMNKTYFSRYNTLNPNNKLIANDGINYCLAVKNVTKPIV